ncbi:MAG: hypothetical protein HOI80_06750 [Alphaproteobacteria bacterium]|jgi:hypothetical protein|nr:hypothetical protein [Alphaproteobacteria bacterium]
MDENQEKAPLDDAPWLIQLSFMPSVLWFAKMRQKRWGSAYLIASAAGFIIGVGLIFITDDSGLNVTGLLMFSIAIVPSIFLIFLPVGILAFTVAPFVMIAGAIGLLGYEAYGFLRYGDWKLHTLLDFEGVREALLDRSDWVGLKEIVYSILQYFPTWGIIIIVAFIILTSDDEITAYEKVRRDYIDLKQNGSGK